MLERNQSPPAVENAGYLGALPWLLLPFWILLVVLALMLLKAGLAPASYSAFF